MTTLPDSERTALARTLVLEHGWNSTAYQILNPGISHWFSADRRAVIGLVRYGSHVLVAGAPVSSRESLPRVVSEFEQDCASRKLRICYVCAGHRLRDELASTGLHSTVPIGAQPVWDPTQWAAIVASRSSLRAQLNRARNKGVSVQPLDPHTAAADAELASVLRDWLQRRALPPLHFLTEPDALHGVVDDRMVLVAKMKGQVIAYLVASPVPARRGYLIEELARSGAAPNGASELLIDAAMRIFAGEGCTYVTLGLVALARNVFEGSPLWLRSLMYFARAHANRFYNFRGIEQFRAKLHPDRWEDIYAISREARFSPGTLYAIGGAFAGISPWRAIGLGMWNALHTEMRNARLLQSVLNRPHPKS